mgnify:CR=1 FL=1
MGVHPMVVLLIIVKILLYLLLFLLGLVFLLLIIPVNYRGQVLTAEGFRAQFAFGWAGKLFGISAEMEGENLDVTLRILDKRVCKLKSKGQEGKKGQRPSPTPGGGQTGPSGAPAWGRCDSGARGWLTASLRKRRGVPRPRAAPARAAPAATAMSVHPTARSTESRKEAPDERHLEPARRRPCPNDCRLSLIHISEPTRPY